VALGHLAEETLGASKSADGLTALRWWREGRTELIEEYCQRDVALLRDLFHHALDKGFVLFRTRSGERVRIPTRFSLSELLESSRRTDERRRRAEGPSPSRRATSTLPAATGRGWSPRS
jgi:DEAD/DEAH box helicase domain-containing protein